MFPGQFTLCLNAKDVASMRRFYETLGFKIHIDSPSNVLLNNGDVDIALMNFLDAPCLNFRGADVFEIQKKASQAMADINFANKPERYKKEQYDASADGTNWNGFDPDGNNIFFDTNENEIGEKGSALALQRILDATAKQLINVGASEECQDVFRTKVLEKFMPAERRAPLANGLDTSPLTEPGQYAGNFTLCLQTKDNEAALKFYEAIGIEVDGNNDEKWVEIGNGDCHFDLMTFLNSNGLNFRGADAFELYDRLKAAGFELAGEPSRYTSEESYDSSPGGHWKTRDPDGNVVYFDTTDPELIVASDPKFLASVLKRTLKQLQNIDAEADCIAVFRTELLDKYTSSKT